jgi:hypothetical protein
MFKPVALIDDGVIVDVDWSDDELDDDPTTDCGLAATALPDSTFVPPLAAGDAVAPSVEAALPEPMFSPFVLIEFTLSDGVTSPSTSGLTETSGPDPEAVVPT